MEIAKAVGRGKQAVSNAVADNCFPASWFTAVRRLCISAGIECPEHLFSFVRPTEFAGGGPGHRELPPDRANA
ncbi:hypothetical protein [Paracoccus sp. (in: a-proteobacteria)]|uniref:hypothetical protein n=1 Tax=Paracoccus sp. TaxID=267 RepID=UPI0028A74D39|nr:hypothetical protein [Paracoccus sp. (in: a-proteobacteria)]